jgi:hypothetical protein
VSDRPEPPQEIPAREQAQSAGAQKIQPADRFDDIDQLRAQCKKFCDMQNSSRSLSLARTKFDEAFFWLRNGRETGQ